MPEVNKEEEFPLVEESGYGDYNQHIRSKTVIIKDVLNKKRFKITLKAMSNAQYADITNEISKIKVLKSTINPQKNIEEQDSSNITMFRDVLYPMTLKLFPECCVNPRIVKGGGKEPNVWDIDAIPLQVATAIIDQIYILSGIGPEADEERKKS